MARRIIIIEEDDNDFGIVDELSRQLGGYGGWNNTYDPCATCNNNPMNNPNASGFCNCVLPYMAGTRYNIT